MIVYQETGHKPIKVWHKGVAVEPSAMEQLHNIASLPFIHKHVAAMPDVHWGMGATVGSVIATKGAIIPAAVGVDIGCGMNAVKTTLTASDLPDSLKEIRHSIERGVPVGFNQHKGGRDLSTLNQQGLWENLIQLGKYAPGLVLVSKAQDQLGTLGGGNHFIELCLDENQQVWVMLHSGSRGSGNKIGQHFIEQAKLEMAKYFISLPDDNLAYLPATSRLFDQYWNAVDWAQDYALENRRMMMLEVLRNLRHHISKPFELAGEAINCHHNYVSHENHFGANVYVTRKGAVSAREGQLGIIPGSMGAKSYIVRGKGNPESFCSCSHGAGRAMSRNQARAKFTIADHRAATEGVECRKDAGVIDETPAAYKDIDAVMAAQTDLVDIVHTLKQVLCVKG